MRTEYSCKECDSYKQTKAYNDNEKNKAYEYKIQNKYYIGTVGRSKTIKRYGKKGR